MYRYLRIILLLAVLTAPHLQEATHASALAAPPTQVRFVIFNAIDGSALTSTPVTVALSSLTGTAGVVTRSILVANDAAADASGNSDLIVNFTAGDTAATPTNGAAGSSNVRVPPGREYNIDGQFTSMSIKARSTSIPVRFIITY